MRQSDVLPKPSKDLQVQNVTFQWVAGVFLIIFITMIGVGWNVISREINRIDRIEVNQITATDRLARIETKLDYLIDDHSSASKESLKLGTVE